MPSFSLIAFGNASCSFKMPLCVCHTAIIGISYTFNWAQSGHTLLWIIGHRWVERAIRDSWPAASRRKHRKTRRNKQQTQGKKQNRRKEVLCQASNTVWLNIKSKLVSLLCCLIRLDLTLAVISCQNDSQIRITSGVSLGVSKMSWKVCKECSCSPWVTRLHFSVTKKFNIQINCEIKLVAWNTTGAFLDFFFFMFWIIENISNF